MTGSTEEARSTELDLLGKHGSGAVVTATTPTDRQERTLAVTAATNQKKSPQEEKAGIRSQANDNKKKKRRTGRQLPQYPIAS